MICCSVAGTTKYDIVFLYLKIGASGYKLYVIIKKVGKIG